MKQVTLLSVDLAKSVFQVAGFTAVFALQFNKQIRRKGLLDFMRNHPPCEVVMEACYTSHYWARKFREMGHTVKLIPAQHVVPFVRGNKSDSNDVIGIAEASRRPNIIAVPVKTVSQQDIQSLHRMRDRCVRQRTQILNQTRGLLAEYGAVCVKGKSALMVMIATLTDPLDTTVSAIIKTQLRFVREEYEQLSGRIKSIEEQLHADVSQNPLSQLLMSIPGIGVINASAIYSAIGNGAQFKSSREFAVWLGLTPRQSSSGNTFKSGGITKRGDRYLRKQLVHGARSLLTSCRKKDDRLSRWANALVARRGHNKACVAMAARLARLCWTLLQKNEPYRAMA